MHTDSVKDSLGLFDVFDPIYIPYWKQWWFIALCIGCIVLIISVLGYICWKLYIRTRRYAIKQVQKKLKCITRQEHIALHNRYDELMSCLDEYIKLTIDKHATIYNKQNLQKLMQYANLSKDEKIILCEMLDKVEHIRFSGDKELVKWNAYVHVVKHIIQ